MADAERTEKPTAKKLEDARKKGQVARSRDVVQVGVLAAAIFALSRWGGHVLSLLEADLTQALSTVGETALQPLGPGDVRTLIFRGGGLVAMTVGPIAAMSIVAAVATSVLQTGWLVTTETITINWGRLSPARGLQRIAKMGGYELLKMVVIVTALGLVGMRATQDVIKDAPRLSHMATAASALGGWTAAEQLLRRALLVLAVVAAADFGVQRYRHRASLRMTKQEVRDEERQRDGSPLIKGRIRRIQRELARKRMLMATKRATVVVTNPTHFAVALEYHREKMAAPRVLAKGTGLLAQRIKEIAKEAGVPLVEQVALAQALYKSTEVGDTIPGELFEAVAEVLAYLIRLKQLVV
jgi:flagellar biosynthetic protein FlhB